LPRSLVSALLLLLAAALLACDASGSGQSGGETPAQAEARRLGLHGTALAATLPRPHFVLTDTAGQPFDFYARTQGRLTLLYFGYTNCPDICPLQLSHLAGALRAAPALRKQVEVVFVGVDAARDTPKRVRSWLDHFDPTFHGLTGTQLALQRAQLAAAVPTASIEARFEGGYTVSHAGWVLVYTPDDKLRLRYQSSVGSAALAQDLGVLLKVSSQGGWPG